MVLVLTASSLLNWGQNKAITNAETGQNTTISVPIYSYKVIASYPHQKDAFTEGLFYRDGILYEGTGLYGCSTIRKVELETGKVIELRKIPIQYFGEGITDWGERLVQITWQSKIGFIYDIESLDPLENFKYNSEGWGITHDGKSLIMSDGTEILRFLDPESFKEIERVRVLWNDTPVTNLNELEYVDGNIMANIWQTNYIAVISPKTGKINGWIDLTGLLSSDDRAYGADVLNGIAYDAKGDRLFVTGKLWPKLFWIELVEKDRVKITEFPIFNY
jgi:glutaminyl-peptide cyclotransferase